MITCLLRYTIAPGKVADFEHYAQVWMRLIEKYGGSHHGYFMPAFGPDAAPPSVSFTFPGIGEAGPANVAVALFSFPDVAAYDSYRREVKSDPECQAVTAHYQRTKCFTKYERTFVRLVER